VTPEAAEFCAYCSGVTEHTDWCRADHPVTPEAEPPDLRETLKQIKALRTRPNRLGSPQDAFMDGIEKAAALLEAALTVRAASPDRPEPGLRAALEGLDAVFGWIEQEHRKVLVEMQTGTSDARALLMRYARIIAAEYDRLSGLAEEKP